MKVTIKGILNESNTEKYFNYLRRVSEVIDPPYVKNMKMYDIPSDYWHVVLSYIFNTNGYIDKHRLKRSREKVIDFFDDDHNNHIYREDKSGWFIYEWEWIEGVGSKIVKLTDPTGSQEWEYNENGKTIRHYINGKLFTDKTLNESTKDDTLYNRMLPLMKRPYGDFLIKNGYDYKMIIEQFKRLFNKDVNVYFNDTNIEVAEIITIIEKLNDGQYSLDVMDEKNRGFTLYHESNYHDPTTIFWEEQKYGHHNVLNMDYVWYVNSFGKKKVTLIGKFNSHTYSNNRTTPGTLPWDTLDERVRNDKFFNLNY